MRVCAVIADLPTFFSLGFSSAPFYCSDKLHSQRQAKKEKVYPAYRWGGGVYYCGGGRKVAGNGKITS